MNARSQNVHVPEWLLAALLSVLIGILGWIGSTLHEMSNSLAVAVTKIDDHERRLNSLEDEYLNRRTRHDAP